MDEPYAKHFNIGLAYPRKLRDDLKGLLTVPDRPACGHPMQPERPQSL
jgi:hypothetical protein